MIKVLAGAIKHAVNRSQQEFHQYWQERHGPLFSKTPELRRYVQHHSLPEAYGGTPTPTLHGASMFWYDDLDALRIAPPSPWLADVVGPEDRALYEWYVAPSRYGDPRQMTLRDTVLIGADRYETDAERAANRKRGVPDLGVGDNTVVDRAILDKDCRVGRDVKIVNRRGLREADADHYVIRDGIVVIPNGAVVPDGTVI